MTRYSDSFILAARLRDVDILVRVINSIQLLRLTNFKLTPLTDRAREVLTNVHTIRRENLDLYFATFETYSELEVFYGARGCKLERVDAP